MNIIRNRELFPWRNIFEPNIKKILDYYFKLSFISDINKVELESAGKDNILSQNI